MFDKEVRPGVFDEHDDDGPTESEWFSIGERRYKVLVVPDSLPTFVPEWCYGNFVGMAVGLLLFWAAQRRSSAWAARVYWQKNRWYNGRYRWLFQDEFVSLSEAQKRADEIVHQLREGAVPIGQPRSSSSEG